MPFWMQRTRLSDGTYSKGARESVPEDDATFLRGAQVADEHGVVQFTTIYPGWYRGRAVHIHAKVHIDRENVLTTQLYFDDDVTDEVYRHPPYDARPNRDTRNADDTIIHYENIIPIEAMEEGYSAYANLAVRVA